MLGLHQRVVDDIESGLVRRGEAVEHWAKAGTDRRMATFEHPQGHRMDAIALTKNVCLSIGVMGIGFSTREALTQAVHVTTWARGCWRHVLRSSVCPTLRPPRVDIQLVTDEKRLAAARCLRMMTALRRGRVLPRSAEATV